MMLFGEMPVIYSIPITNEVNNALFVSGVLGFLINIAIFMQVKFTTPLTNAISGTAKVLSLPPLSVLTYTEGLCPDTSWLVLLWK